MTITVPPELAVPLAAEAARRGTSPEQLVLAFVRKTIADESAIPKGEGSLLDLLGDLVGSVAGSTEPFSQDCGKRFADGLASGQPARP